MFFVAGDSMAEIVVKISGFEPKLEKELAKSIEILARAEVTRVLLLERLGKLLAKSELTEEECIALGREVNKAVRERLEFFSTAELLGMKA